MFKAIATYCVLPTERPKKLRLKFKVKLIKIYNVTYMYICVYIHVAVSSEINKKSILKKYCINDFTKINSQKRRL